MHEAISNGTPPFRDKLEKSSTSRVDNWPISVGIVPEMNVPSIRKSPGKVTKEEQSRSTNKERTVTESSQMQQKECERTKHVLPRPEWTIGSLVEGRLDWIGLD